MKQPIWIHDKLNDLQENGQFLWGEMASVQIKILKYSIIFFYHYVFDNKYTEIFTSVGNKEMKTVI